MITVKSYHGKLPSNLASEMDKIALPIQPGTEWEFEGSVGDFANQWGKNFLAMPEVPATKNHYAHYQIFVTQHSSFGMR
jgi:hypothetical protein